MSATLHNAEKLTANLDVTTRQLNMLMQKDLPQLTGKLNTIADNFIAISDNLKGIDYASTFNKIDSTLYNVQNADRKNSIARTTVSDCYSMILLSTKI